MRVRWQALPGGLPFRQGPDDNDELLDEEVAVARLEDVMTDVAGGSDWQARDSTVVPATSEAAAAIMP